jgi:cytochrome P450
MNVLSPSGGTAQGRSQGGALPWAEPTGRDALRRALRRERRVHVAAHPLAYPLALVLRRLGPVLRVPGIGHVVNDPAIARAVLTDNDGFAKNGPGSAGELITQVMGDYALLNLEGDAHRELHALLVAALNVSAVHDLVQEVWGTGLDEAVSTLRAGRRVDLARLATVLTGRTMGRLLGIGRLDDDGAALAAYQLGETMVSVVRLRSGRLSPRVVARSRQRFLALTHDMAAGLASAPAGSIIGRLRVAGFNEAQVRGVGAALLLTGTGTVSTALPRTAALISDAGLWEQLGDRSARLAAIDECLRVITPSPVMLRSVRRDTVVAHHRFQEGRRVAILTYAAVRACEDGDALRLDRDVPASVRGLYFGAGRHHCIGYALARAELDLAVERLGSVGPLRVTRRAAAFHVLIPRYRVLEVEKVP